MLEDNRQKGLTVQDFLAHSDVPEFYIDSVKVLISVYGLALELGISGLPDTPSSEPPPVKRLAIVRMSPQHALVLARVLRQNVKVYEDKVGKIELPPDLLKQLGIESD